MVDSNLLQHFQRFQSSQTFLGLSQHRLAVGNARFNQGCRLCRFSLDPSGASLELCGEITIPQSARVVRPSENFEKCRQRSPGLLPVHRHRACGIRAHPDSPDTKKPPQKGGRVMGISTAYPNGPVIAGHLKKRRQQKSADFSTILWRNCTRLAICGFCPPDVVAPLHKLDEKHYTYRSAR